MSIGGSVVSKVAKMVATTGGAASGGAQELVSQVGVALSKGLAPIKDASAVLSRILGQAAGQGSMRIAADGAARMRFVHILEEALEKAQRPGGNVQTQINDLTVRLRNLARETAEAQAMSPQQLQGLLAKQQQMHQTMSNILKKHDEMMKGVIQNIR